MSRSKTCKNKRNFGGNVGDLYKLRGKKLCGRNHNVYIGDVFSSSNFLIYSLCENATLDKCEKVLAKIYKLNKTWLTSKKINKEVSFIKKASELGLTPKLLFRDICKYNKQKYYIVALERWGDGTLNDLSKTDYYKHNKQMIKDKLKHILDILYDNNINHNDLHAKNFLYKFENDELIFKIIDFDLSTELDEDKPVYTINVLDDKDRTIEVLNLLD